MFEFTQSERIFAALKRRYLLEDIPFPKVPRRLPIILSVEEVGWLLDSARNLMDRTLLMVLYSTGMRNRELRNLLVKDIDSKAMLIHIQHGKGGRDRYVPLSPKLLETLREYGRWMKPKTWLFPGTVDGWRAGAGDGLLEITDEDDVAGRIAALEGELLTVARPGKEEDPVGFEIGDLLWRATGERLPPDIGSPPASQCVVERLAIGSPVDLKCAHGQIEPITRRSATERNHGKDTRARHRRRHGAIGEQLTVRRNSECSAGRVRHHHLRGRPALNRHLPRGRVIGAGIQH